jgi:hypothetical protein
LIARFHVARPVLSFVASLWHPLADFFFFSDLVYFCAAASPVQKTGSTGNGSLY